MQKRSVLETLNARNSRLFLTTSMDYQDVVISSKEPFDTHLPVSTHDNPESSLDGPVWESPRSRASMKGAARKGKVVNLPMKAMLHEQQDLSKDKDKADHLLSTPPSKQLRSERQEGRDDSSEKSPRCTKSAHKRHRQSHRNAEQLRKRAWNWNHDCDWDNRKAQQLSGGRLPPPAPKKEFKEADDGSGEWRHMAKVLPFTYISAQPKKTPQEAENDLTFDIVRNQIIEEVPKAGNVGSHTRGCLFQLKVDPEWNKERTTPSAGGAMKTLDMIKQVVLPYSISKPTTKS
jgi:hypothetical protein